jgi:Uma2 family endonuclease
MSTVIVDDVRVKIPERVKDLASFRRWTKEADFPQTGNVWWLRGEVWADMSSEQIFSHLAVKGELFRVLANLTAELDGALMLPDGLLYTNEGADISGNPDATYISPATRETGRVTLIEGRDHGYVEVLGSPDMVLEVVSEGSVTKDTETLFEAYWRSGVREYWIVDARESRPAFDVWRHTPKGYVSARKKDGWVKSNVFGKSFRLVQSVNRFGDPQYRLEVR